ncbi:MAG: SMP-30/gluconolactonase/LRE family protein [Proteobacteria bacterium]|nr:SMP-30/gluconolactonase/LRE family protein [Pseudomonadota bacterium]
MFNAPPELKTRVFTTLPDKFRIKGRLSEWAFGKNDKLDSFLEGLCFSADGTMYVSDIPYGRIFKVDGQGSFELVVEYDGEPNGTAFDASGKLFIADHKHGVITVDVKERTVGFHLTRLRRERFRGLNDLVFDRAGNLYFNDQGQSGMQDPTGRVYRLNKDGTVDAVIGTIPSPNGMAFGPNGRLIYVTVTRANQIWRLPIHADGSCTKAGVHLHMQGGSTGPDGIAVDVAGNVLVCQCGTDSAWLFSPWGEPLFRIRSCAGHDLTSAAYGGPDGKTLYMTEAESGQILEVEMPIAGLPLIPGAG